MPDSVSKTAIYASVQENVLDRNRKLGYKAENTKSFKQFGGSQKVDNRVKFTPNLSI